jgi:hypothetical protein
VSHGDVWTDDEDSEELTFFRPAIFEDQNASEFTNTGVEQCRQWFIVAQGHENIIQLFCIPLGWHKHGDTDNDDDEEDGESMEFPFYLTSKLILPQGGSISDIGFYGDDGKSSLSSGMDSGSGMEGRQKLGFLYQEPSTSSASLGLWMLSYDSLFWQVVPSNDSVLISPTKVHEQCTRCVVPIIQADGNENDHLGDGVLHSQSEFTLFGVTPLNAELLCLIYDVSLF